MRTTSNYDNSWAAEIGQTVTLLPDSLGEKIKYLELMLALVNAENERIQAKRDDERSGYLMKQIILLIEQLGIPSSHQRILKAMTTLQLDAYAEELYQQLKNRPFKHLSAA